MLSNKELNQLIQILLNEENKDVYFEFGYMGLQEDDLLDVVRDMEFTPEQQKSLEEYGSNFIMILTDDTSYCSSSSWESWVHNENTPYIDGLHSIWESEVQDVRENTPFQICLNNEWVGTLPYTEELVERLSRVGVNKCIETQDNMLSLTLG
jgi:hypothetical protein